MTTATKKRFFHRTAQSRWSRFLAHLELDYTEAPRRPTTWTIRLHDRSTDERVATLTFNGPYTQGRETELVAWIRGVQQTIGVDDGDLFAFDVRREAYDIIVVCYLADPDTKP